MENLLDSNVDRFNSLKQHAQLIMDGDLDIEYVIEGNIDLLFDDQKEKELFIQNVLSCIKLES